MAINSLIDHIANHGSDGGVTIGANTPAPYGGANLTGFVDGTGPQNASKNMAEFYNRQVFAAKHLLEAAGLTWDPANWAQMTQAVQSIALDANPKKNNFTAVMPRYSSVRNAGGVNHLTGQLASMTLTNPSAILPAIARVGSVAWLINTTGAFIPGVFIGTVIYVDGTGAANHAESSIADLQPGYTLSIAGPSGVRGPFEVVIPAGGSIQLGIGLALSSYLPTANVSTTCQVWAEVNNF
jgi:hypothetical protein